MHRTCCWACYLLRDASLPAWRARIPMRSSSIAVPDGISACRPVTTAFPEGWFGASATTIAPRTQAFAKPAGYLCRSAIDTVPDIRPIEGDPSRSLAKFRAVPGVTLVGGDVALKIDGHVDGHSIFARRSAAPNSVAVFSQHGNMRI